MKKELKNTKRKNNKGFSLVELIVVIAIMAVLMAVLAPAMLRYVEKSRVQKDASAVSEAANAAELALADEDIYKKAADASNADITVVVKDNTEITSSLAEVATDVKKTVGDKIAFVAKAHKGQTATITLTYDSTKEAYIIGSTTWTK